MKYKILVDGISLLSSLTGIGRYTYEISKNIEKSEYTDMSYYYGYFSKNLIHPSDKKDLKILKSLVTKNLLLKKIIRKILIIIGRLFSKTYDLYWQPNFIPNLNIKAKKTITSVHDFSFILHKDYHPKERIEYFEKFFFENIKKSDEIITGSMFSKKEILERLNFPEDKIHVIYHGINHNLFKRYNNLDLNFELPNKFIFSVGSIEPRKNLMGLLKAYNLLNEQIKEEYKLVLAGFQGWENDEIMDYINKNKKYIHYLGFISDIELAKVYNLASCFIFPSFYEGFGIPPLEAMACGTPVICSNTSSLPEVGGEAVLYCNPFDIDDIKNKIELLLKDKDLQNDLIKKGLKRAQLFSWEKSAREHLEIFKKVLSIENSTCS